MMVDNMAVTRVLAKRWLRHDTNNVLAATRYKVCVCTYTHIYIARQDCIKKILVSKNYLI